MSQTTKSVLIPYVNGCGRPQTERIELTARTFNLTPQQAVLMDRITAKFMDACLSGFGDIIDEVDDPAVKAVFAFASGGVIAAAFEYYDKLSSDIAMLHMAREAFGDDPVIKVPNPLNPTCTCASCMAIRHLSPILVELPEVNEEALNAAEAINHGRL